MHNRHFKSQKKTTMLILTLMLFILLHSSIQFVNAEQHDESDSDVFLGFIEAIINWKKVSIGIDTKEPLFNNIFLENAGDTTGDWYPIGMGRIGYDDEYDSYLAVIRDVVEKSYKEKNKLSDAKATEWHRISLAILASGGDPTKIAEDEKGKPINLIADGTYNRGKTASLGSQGLNGWIWGLITLDSMRYIVPEDAFNTRKSIIEEILKEQLPDGGFSLNLPESDTDMTAMAIQALAPYYNSEETYTYKQRSVNKQVTKTIREVIDEALEMLSKSQLEDGDFGSMDTPNAESTAQVIVALSALGIDPFHDERFIENNNNLLQGLLKFIMDDGGFIHSETYDPDNPSSLPDESNTMASEQTLYALVASFRYYESYRTLYDFREEPTVELKAKIQSVKESIEMLPDTLTQEHEGVIKNIFKDYLSIPIEERSYVFNYFKLADAMKELGIDNTSEPISENIGINKEGKGAIISLFDKGKIHASDIVFTENDAIFVNNLPEEVSTENYVDVVKLKDKLENASNRVEYEHLLDILIDKKEKIEKIEKEIETLNQTIIDQLYPFSDISIKDRDNVEKIVKRYESLSTYDQNKIQSYEDVEKAETQINNLIRARYITIAAIITIVIVSFFYIKRNRKRKREKMKQKMMVDQEG